MDDAVKIPVIVTGAEASQAQLRATQAVLENLRRAGVTTPGAMLQEAKATTAATEEQARAQDKLAQGTGRADEAANQFGRHGRVLMLNLLREMNPELGSAASMVFHLAMGLEQLTPALLTMAGAGAVVGLLTMALNAAAEAGDKAREALRRMHEAEREEREQGLSARERVFKAMQAAGVVQTPAQQSATIGRVREMQLAGTTAEDAIAALAAQQAGRLTDEQLETYLSGLALLGEKAPKPEGGPLDQRAIQKVLEAGALPEALAQRQAKLRAVGETARREAPLPSAEAPEEGHRLDTEIRRMMRERPEIGEEGEKYLRRLVFAEGGPEAEAVETWREKIRRALYEYWSGATTEEAGLALEIPGTGKTTGELVEMAKEIMRRGAVGVEEFNQPAPGENVRISPVVNIQQFTTNVNHAYGPVDPFRHAAPASTPEMAGIGD